MPTYDYRCPNGHDFEHFVRKISDAAAELACPVCGALAQRRVSGGAGLVFKGSGFYLTDYGKNAHRKGASDTSGGGESKSDAGASTGGDGAKSDTGSSAGAKSESSAAPKSDGAKSTESKAPTKSKGDGGSSGGGSGSGDSK